MGGTKAEAQLKLDMRLRYRGRIPIVGNVQAAMLGGISSNHIRRVLTEAEKRTRSAALIKPGRCLGGPWIDSSVAQRRSVSLCANCSRRYGDWHTRYHYRKRDRAELSDCDGCGQFVICSGYYSAIM